MVKYLNLHYKPTEEDLICKFYVEPNNISLERCAEQVAAESSIGTWTEVKTMSNRIEKMRAKVFEINKKSRIVKIAYPIVLFERANISQIMSSIAGNIFGMKTIKNLRLLDVEIPKVMIKSFKGPAIGLDDIRRIMNIKDFPIIGTIFKPKLGLTPKEMAKLAYKIYSAGVDYTKDDENLASMEFNRFEERVIRILDVVDKIKREQGRQVIYAPNITSQADKMLERAEFVKKQGGKCIMVDIITCGWSSLQFIVEKTRKMKLIIHAHRAGHAMFTRNKKHGISMLVIAKFARLAGVSALHTGTVVGKMEGKKSEVVEINNFLRSGMQGIKKVMPIASGGLHPKLVPEIIKILGSDLIINFGGGLWGHPLGPEAGAKAIRQAIEATIKGIPLEEYAKSKKDLKIALKTWK